MVHSSFARRALTAACCLVFLLCIALTCSAAPWDRQVLVISVTKGFAHSAIPLGEEVLAQLGKDSGMWVVDYARTDEDIAQKMTADALAKYQVIVFNNTTGDLPLPDRDAFMNWVKAGGGIVGLHAATDTFHNWPEFIEMMGAEFAGHGAQKEVEFLKTDPNHVVTRGLPESFKHTEEVYLFKKFSPEKVRVLIGLDKHPTEFTPGFYPISWVKNYGKGRVFYTAFGHREDLLASDYVKTHLLQGMKWALGLAPGSTRPLLPPKQISGAEIAEGFIPLFNGRDLEGWHVRSEGRNPWTVQHGMLVMGHGGSDLITDQKFGDFIARYEYMVPPGGNSGFYLRGRYEIQVMDDFGSKQATGHGNGAIYGKTAPSEFASRPAGEWQKAEVKLVGNRVTVILNGVKIHDNQPIDGPTGGAIDGNVDQPGPIMLQGDHGPIAYRNIMIKPL